MTQWCLDEGVLPRCLEALGEEKWAFFVMLKGSQVDPFYAKGPVETKCLNIP